MVGRAHPARGAEDMVGRELDELSRPQRLGGEKPGQGSRSGRTDITIDTDLIVEGSARSRSIW
jgi:hypothetical protein